MRALCISILLATTIRAQSLSLRAQPDEHTEKETQPSPPNEDVESRAGERRLQNWKCVGSSLKWGQELRYYEEEEYNEFICLNKSEPTYWNSNDYRFGIYEGRVVMLSPDDEEIWGSDNKDRGTHIRLQKGGKLVLLDDHNRAVWAMKHGCRATKGRLEMRKTGFYMENENGDVKWYIDFDGTESGCDPAPKSLPEDPCKDVINADFDDSDDQSCRVLAMNTDSYNYEQVLLEVKKLGAGKFQVTDVEKRCWFCNSKWNKGWSKLPQKTFDLSFSDSGALVVDGKPSSTSCQEIVDGIESMNYYWEFYEVYESGSGDCSRFGRNLLELMVDYYEDDDVWGCISDC